MYVFTFECPPGNRLQIAYKSLANRLRTSHFESGCDPGYDPLSLQEVQSILQSDPCIWSEKDQKIVKLR